MIHVVGFVGAVLMCVAFGLTALRGGWYHAGVRPDEDVEFPLQRQMMFAGAILVAVYFFLITLSMFVPALNPLR
jgi:ABC-type Na+ efflux pump permease subunit